jgi:isoleucyl-tRNA synthetase
LERAAKRIGSSLQASARVHADEPHRAALEGLDLAEIAIVSDAVLSDGPAPAGAFTLPDIAGVAAVIVVAQGDKCQRCWRVLPEVAALAHGLCERCTGAVRRREAGAA